MTRIITLPLLVPSLILFFYFFYLDCMFYQLLRVQHVLRNCTTILLKQEICLSVYHFQTMSLGKEGIFRQLLCSSREIRLHVSNFLLEFSFDETSSQQFYDKCRSVGHNKRCFTSEQVHLNS